jgi:hypothetical protein
MRDMRTKKTRFQKSLFTGPEIKDGHLSREVYLFHFCSNSSSFDMYKYVTNEQTNFRPHLTKTHRKPIVRLVQALKLIPFPLKALVEQTSLKKLKQPNSPCSVRLNCP